MITGEKAQAQGGEGVREEEKEERAVLRAQARAAIATATARIGDSRRACVVALLEMRAAIKEADKKARARRRAGDEKLYLAPNGDTVTHDELQRRIRERAAGRSQDLRPLGLGASAVKVDANLPDSDSMGLGGEFEEIVSEIISNTPTAEYKEEAERRIAANVAARAELPPLPRPPFVGTHCEKGDAAEVPSPLVAATFEADFRGSSKFGALHHAVRHGFRTRSTIERKVDVKPRSASSLKYKDELADAHEKEIAEGVSIVYGNREEAIAKSSSICDCRGPALIVSKSGAIDKRDNDHGGEVVGARPLQMPTELNATSPDLDWCEGDRVGVTVGSGCELIAIYEARGARREDIQIVMAKRDFKGAFKHCFNSPCVMYQMGQRLWQWHCKGCGEVRSPYENTNRCQCDQTSPKEARETYGAYAAMSFGASASAYNFGKVSAAFVFMLRTVLVCVAAMWVDDAALLGVLLRQADGTFSEEGVDLEHRISWAWYCYGFLARRYGLRESLSKQIKGSSVTNLGVVNDWYRMELRLAPQRLARVRELLSDWVTREFASLRDLQKLRGLLGWCTEVIHGARTLLPLINNQMRKLNRPYHRGRLAGQTRMAIQWLEEIFRDAAGSRMIKTSQWLKQAEIDFATDASGGENGGYGGYFRGSYFSGVFGAEIALAYTIAELELATVVIALLVFGPLLRGKRVVVTCDNTNATAASEKGSRSQGLQYLSLALMRVAARFDIDVRIVWTRSKDNRVADLASRDRLAFLRLAAFRGAAPCEVQVPIELFRAALEGAKKKKWSWEWTEGSPATGVAVEREC